MIEKQLKELEKRVKLLEKRIIILEEQQKLYRYGHPTITKVLGRPLEDKYLPEQSNDRLLREKED